ncbi:MAG: flagellar basal-body MS-ring/collar protein FliF [Elusimicrobiota bacterium]
MDFFAQLKQYFDKLSLGQKLMTVGVFISVSAAVFLLSYVLKQDGYTVLFARLSPEDASQIVEQLKNENIPYRLSDSGRTVNVPTAQVYDLRLKMSGAGLPKGGHSGLELFDKGSVGMTDFTQQVNYQRAIQGELSRTISELQNIQHARVHITFPDESSFLEEEKAASASVVLTLQPGAVLDQKQIQGIVNLVSGAVKGLKPENVTLVDTYGNLLTKSGDDQSLFTGADNSLNLRKTVENYLEGKALSLLEKVLGPGKSVVKVTAILNNQRIHEQTESYDPNGTVRSEQVSKEAAGTSLKNYEVGKTVREVVGTAGNIEKLYISVVIDGIVKVDDENKSNTTVIPRTEEELNNYKQLVMQAVGFSEEREDQIDIKSIPFDREHKDNISKQMEEQEKAVAKTKSQEKIMSLAGKGIISLSMIVIVFMTLKTMKKSVSEQKSSIPASSVPQLGNVPVSAPALAGSRDVSIPVSASTPSMQMESSRQEPLALEAPVQEQRIPVSAELGIEILKAAKENPEEVARTMQRAWIKK